MTLLDPSGSGNTTTLMMIAGFETPSRGRIRVDGRDIAADPADRRNFGIVFQPCALFPHMSVLDNAAFPLRMKGVGIRARQPQAAEMLEKVGSKPWRRAGRTGSPAGGSSASRSCAL